MRLSSLVLAIGLMAVVGGPALGQDQEAHYVVIFDAVWSPETHPDEFPPSPHFSPLIGGAHNDQVQFWTPGDLATPGIESMAETGSTRLLAGEVEDAIALGDALAVVRGPGISLSPGMAETEFDVTQDHSLVTLVTMIAPSPDWFVGVHGLELFQNGQWVDRLVVDLLPWDSGTDSGTTYTSPNEDTNPPEPIQLITSPPVGNGVPLGTFTFIRCEEASRLSYGSGFPGTNGVPTLDSSEDPQLGSSFTIDIGNSLGSSASSVLFVGLNAASLPGTWGGDLLVVPAFSVPLSLPGAGLSLPVTLPGDSELCGMSVYLQSIQQDPGAANDISNSAGLELILGQ